MNGSVYEDSDSSSDAASLSPRPQLNEPQRVSGCVLVYGQVSVLKRPTNICQKRVNEETKVEAQQGTFSVVYMRICCYCLPVALLPVNVGFTQSFDVAH